MKRTSHLPVDRSSVSVHSSIPFKISVAHTQGRTLAMADYLSRHPSPSEGSIIKSEQLLNDWRTVIVVNDFETALGGANVSKCERPIKSEKAANSQSLAENSVLILVNDSDSGGQKNYMHGLRKDGELNKQSHFAKIIQNARE